MLALDVQGFLRIVRDGSMIFDGWPGREKILCMVSVLKTDVVEARLLTGEDDRYRAARRLAELGPREVLLTHGGGALVYTEGAYSEAPFIVQEVRGRSGRGDTCTSAYLSRRLTADPSDAVRWAAVVTSLKLEAEGPFRRSLGEVESLYTCLQTERRT